MNGPPPTGQTGETEQKAETNQATVLYELAKQHYRLLRSEDGEAYGVQKDGPNIAIPLGRGAAFSHQMVRLFYESEGKVPSDQAETMAVKLLRAYLDDEEHEPIHLRAARHGDSVVLDLGTPDGSCVIVTAEGWRVEDRSPVVFRRSAGLPLPIPQRDPDGLARLRPLVNASEEQFRLGVAWLVAALMPGVPHPILIVRGEQGTAKTTLARIFQTIIDPSGIGPGALPKDERDLAVRMVSTYVQAFDNVSSIPAWLSDALCRAAYGETFVTRTLYSNRDVTIMRYTRPIMLNTIDAGALNGDLVERGMPLDLERIPPENRRTERATIGDDPDVNPGIYDQLDKDSPVILGALLDLVSAVLQRVSEVTTGAAPRMANFGKILAAIDLVQGWKSGPLFADLVDSETGSLVEQSPFATRLVEFMDSRDDEWRGTATALLDELARLLADKDRPPKGWPADATRASGQLRRFAPALRQHGLAAERDREGKARTRTWQITKLASAASAASATPSDLAKQADAKADASEQADASVRLASATASATFPQADSHFDPQADAADAKTPENFPDLPPNGECSRCGDPCRRYGDGGSPLCPGCRPTPAAMPKRRDNSPER